MKRKLATILCVVLALTMLLATGAMAASTEPAVNVRVNGEIVQFPDAQPYVDGNNRTLIPVRFVTEQLGATVTWDGKTQTAVIEQDGIRVDIPIGSNTMSVTKNGKIAKTQMDTAAVLKDGRTYVPIRYVAEALGAYVDYSEVYKTVGIYKDKLSADEIETLRGYAYTQPQYGIGYEENKTNYDAESLAFFYGTDRDTFGNYANAREHLFHTMKRNGHYGFAGIETIMEGGTNDEFYSNVVKEAIAEINYESERLSVSFKADGSCIYQADAMDRLSACVRGIATIQLHVKPTELTGAETLLLCKLGFSQLYQDKVVSNPVDVHMNTISDYTVNVHTIVPLAEVTE